MILPAVLQDLVILHIVVSIVFGFSLLFVLDFRRAQNDKSRDGIIDLFLVRVFLWLQLILGSACLGGILIETMHREASLF